MLPLVFLFLFWLSFLLLAWTFVGYPLSVIVLAKFFSKPWRKGEYSGSVSMIIAAHNEEDVIRDKVENCLSLDFGRASAEIIIVSDGSTDKTDNILDEFSNNLNHLRVITYQPRAGKANALNVAVAEAHGEILMFGDANVMVDAESCKELLSPFADPEVGVVCGRVLVRDRGEDEVGGEGIYMRYEAAVQYAEARLGSMVGVDGAFFAMRGALFAPLASDVILDDFALSMRAPAVGLRIVYEKNARAVEEVVPSAANEFKRKARIVSGGYQFLAHAFSEDGKFSYKMWFSFFSHKILRWLAPHLLLTLLLVNALLLSSTPYLLLFLGQLFFYFLAFLGFWKKELRTIHCVYLPYYFCVVNFAAFVGLVRYASAARQTALWEKVSR
jgi:cellulose synthase/poly-beta-1,6-N-acetylglucosamine synthase-like glycosyltransferase